MAHCSLIVFMSGCYTLGSVSLESLIKAGKAKCISAACAALSSYLKYGVPTGSSTLDFGRVGLDGSLCQKVNQKQSALRHLILGSLLGS